MSYYRDQSGPGLPPHNSANHYYRGSDDPHGRSNIPYRRNENPYQDYAQVYRRMGEPYQRIDVPYQKRRDEPHPASDNQHGLVRGSRVFEEDWNNRRLQNGYGSRWFSGDGFQYDIYKPELGVYSFKHRPDPVIYEVDHLVTFEISPKLGMKSHRDGLERLSHMQLTSGVWTMRYLLSIDDREIVITEKSTRKELESFPISHVHDPVNITSNDPKELYDDIVMFTVQGDMSRKLSEMHIFQSIGKPGQDIVNDIEAARMGKFPRIVKEQSPSVSSQRFPLYSPPKLPQRSLGASVFEADIDLLNQCFDSIERFVISLQQAALAKKKLDQSRSSGMVDANTLEVMARKAEAPSARKFVDVFQKFKFALNLLPKLRYILKDPNAQELTHMLFAPLSLVVQASRDAQGQPRLASSVTSPLLNRDTCILLDTSLRGHEIALWRQLGDSWNIPAQLWKGPSPPPYIPRFTNDSTTTSLAGNLEPGSQGMSGVQNGGPGSQMSASHSSASIDPKQEEFLQRLRARNAKVCRIIKDRFGSNPKELTVVNGEYVEVLEDTKNWWKVSNIRNTSGFIPNNIVAKV